jgi:hypothetical protein
VPSATVSFAPTSATQDAPQFPLPLPISLCPRSPAVLRAAAEVRHRRPGPPLRHRRHRGVPGTRFEVRNLSRPLQTCVLPSVTFDSSPELFNAAAEPLCRRPPPSGAPAPTQTPPEDSPRLPQLPRSLRSPQRPAERPRPSSPASPPPRGRAPPPQLAVGEAEAGHPIPAVRPRSGGPVLIRPSLILAVRRRSNGPGPLPPHPALPAGPACQPVRARSARWPRLSARPRPLCPLAPPVSRRARAARPAPPVSRPGRRALARPPADLILAVRLRSDGRRNPIPLRPRVFLKRPPVFWNLNPPSLVSHS